MLLLVAIGAGGIAYSMYKDQNSLMVQTNKIMDGIPTDCYVMFPDSNDHYSKDAVATYYPSMINNINKTGIKYLYPFLRSSAFHLYLYQNCPYLDTAKNKVPEKFNQSLGTENTLIKPDNYIIDSERKEQKLFEYNIVKNPNNYTKIEHLAGNFSLNFQQVVDKLFWENATDIDYCKNPSFMKNSTLRQCTFDNSHFLVNKNTEELIGILDAPPKTNKSGKSNT